jgi:hypothetical protein
MPRAKRLHLESRPRENEWSGVAVFRLAEIADSVSAGAGEDVEVNIGLVISIEAASGCNFVLRRREGGWC